MATTRRRRTTRKVVKQPATPPEIEDELDVDEEAVEEEEEEEAPAPPKRRRGRPRKTPPPEPEPEDDEDEDEDDEEEEAPAPPKRRRGRPRKSAPPEPEPEDEDEDEDEDDEEEEAPVKRTRRTRRTRTKAPEPEPEEEEEEDDTPQELAKASAGGTMDILLRALDAGRTLTLSKTNGMYTITSGEAVRTASKSTTKRGRGAYAMTQAEMEAIATTAEYQKHSKSWKKLSLEEKIELANEAGAEWEPHDNELTHNLRVTMAYMEAKGIEKWYPEYRTKAARDRLWKDGIEAEPED